MPEPVEQVVYSQETYGELKPFDRREWLLTNGIGGFAGGTVVGANTRRYHGLLVAATLPPVGRVVALSRFAEVLRVDADVHDLSCAYFRGELVGDGDKLLRRFHLEREVASWEYDVAGTKVYKDVLVCWEQNTVGVRYRVVPGPAHSGRTLSLALSPFVAMRDFHSLRHTGEVEFAQGEERRAVTVRLRDLTLSLWRCDHDDDVTDGACAFEAGPDWWYGTSYPMETARGLDDREDLYTPGTFSLKVDGESSVTVWAALGEAGGRQTLDWDRERLRRLEQMKVPPMPTPTQQKLVRAAADFVVKRNAPDGRPGTTVIAGYPWFSDWGRDTFIALPGLLLTTGRHHEAGRVLGTFAHYVSEGMIPNRFNDYSNEPEYNTVDASLWFVQASHAYLKATKDRDTYESVLRPACEEIVAGYTRGTRYKIGVDAADGLVTAGDETTQLTWMDAKRGEVVFTPRQGKATEINALWYNALVHLGMEQEAARVRESFVRAFWKGEGVGLADVVTNGEADASIRPNQIFAVSLPHSPLTGEQQKVVVDVVRRELLTPVGMRTLSRGAAKYEPHYTGPMFDRDRAYHNGTVWPWLIGPFLDAHLRINGRSAESVARARVWLTPLIDHLSREGDLGSICEVFDAEFPHKPGGCFAQAWSVAEVLRLAVELEM